MEALYFPHLSLPPSSWVNPALLYFDRIDVIAPDGHSGDLFDERTDALLREGMVRTIHPFSYHWSEGEDERFIAFLYGVARAPPRMPGVERLHFRKISHTSLGEELTRSGLLMRVEGDWLEGPRWVCAYVMGYLAWQLSSHPELQLPLVTDEDAAERLMIGKPLRRSHPSRRSRAVSKLLPVPGYVSVRALANFKEEHRRELLAFRGFVEELVTRDCLTEEDEARFEERLGEAVRLRAHLEGEIKGVGWQPSGIEVSLAAATAVAPALEGLILSSGVGLLSLAYMAAQGVRGGARRRRARRDPLVYAAIASGAWRPREGRDILR